MTLLVMKNIADYVKTVTNCHGFKMQALDCNMGLADVRNP
jgi:hypothetical protein